MGKKRKRKAKLTNKSSLQIAREELARRSCIRHEYNEIGYTIQRNMDGTWAWWPTGQQDAARQGYLFIDDAAAAIREDHYKEKLEDAA